MLKLRRISANHRDAFLQRYDELHSWAVQMTAGDRPQAEDLLHDLFILFTLSQPDLSRIQNLDHYLYASLRNLHVSQLRRATRAPGFHLDKIDTPLMVVSRRGMDTIFMWDTYAIPRALRKPVELFVLNTN